MEGAFRAIECRLAQMNVFSHYCLTFSANDCVFSLNEQQKVYSKHLESSVAIYSLLQGALFVETAQSHQRNFWNITDCKIILEKSGIA